MKLLASFSAGSSELHYLHDEPSGQVGLVLRPQGRGEAGTLAALPGPIDPLAQVKLVGDRYPGAFSQGRTMRNAPSNAAFRFTGQRVADEGGARRVLTFLESEAGCALEHEARWHDGDSVAEVRTTFHNRSPQPVTLELLTSFSLGGIVPLPAPGRPGRLVAHRFRSGWSAEGRLESRTLAELHLERSWAGAAAFTERFGQRGSMPVREWFPCAYVEDPGAGVVWGAQLAWAGSWQIELFRQHDALCLSGGLADREFGHWLKTLAPGESLEAPPAMLVCVEGGLDDACDQLTAHQHRAADRHPEIERSLPIVFNEWCSSWGDPTHGKMVALADRLRGSEVRYLVIDAGWYKTEGADWASGHGDWQPSARLFPEGIERTAKAIRARGFIPGLWFEMETVGEKSTAFTFADHLLARDGVPLTSGQRRFWDLSDPFAVAWLEEKVIGLLERGGFGYLKVDYNETIGIGCDGAESLGEGLRLQTLGTHRLFDRIRERLPHLVIENCASGGHRLEPSMLGRAAMSSFSDAHECAEIPIIAANLQRLILPRQSQIWAVLRAADSDRRLVYSLAAAFLGRMCLSGEIERLSAAQFDFVTRAMALYRRAAPVLARGVSRRFGAVGESWREPEGGQIVRRVSEDGAAMLVVAHTFAHAPARLAAPLPEGGCWSIVEELRAEDGKSVLEEGELHCPMGGDFAGRVVLLARALD